MAINDYVTRNYGEDLDPTASYISYTQFSLLGYPAIVTNQDSLSMKIYEGPWYTPGYYLHGMPMRLLIGHMDSGIKREDAKEEDKKVESIDNINVRDLVQGEFNFQ